MKRKKTMLVIMFVVLCVVSLFTRKEDNKTSVETETTETTIVENPVEIQKEEILNGLETEVIGECLIVKTQSVNCTEDFLTDVYYNYYITNDYNYGIIVYTDKENIGGYINTGLIELNCEIIKENNGTYCLGETFDDSIFYTCEKDGTIVKMDL